MDRKKRTARAARCVIAGEAMITNLIRRFDGLGKPLIHDEREILMFALYNDSEMLGGLVKKAYPETKDC